MCRVTPGTARVFADLGCVERVVGLLSSGVCCVQEEAALALAQLLLLDEEGEDDEECGGVGLTDKAIGLGAIGYLLDMVTSGVTSSMRAAGGGGFRVSEG
jgi:hypothetical protein